MKKLVRIAALCSMIASTLPANPSFSEEANPSCRKGASSSSLDGEILHFAVSIFGFILKLTDAASAEIFAQEISRVTPLRIESGLKAQTKGLAFIASGGLYQEHRSKATFWPDGSLSQLRRFVTTYYKFSQKGGDNPQEVEFKVNYDKGELYRFRRKPPEGPETSSSWKIPPGVLYEDLLTVLYNLRRGLRRLPVKGEKLTVKTLPFEGDRSYEEILISRAEAKEEEIRNGEALILVDIPKGILREGRRIQARAWFEEKTLVLKKVLAEKVVPILLFPDGDATGSFVCFGNNISSSILP